MTGSDADQLRSLLQRYARAIDVRDMATLRAVFHPDAVIDGAQGPQTIGEWLQAMSAPRAYPISMHFLGEPLIRLDRDTAELDTYGVVYQALADRPELTLGIRYLDAAVRRDGGWVILSRRTQRLWNS